MICGKMSGKSVEKLMEKSVESVEKNSWKSVVSHQSSEILLKNVGAKYTYDVVFWDFNNGVF